MLNQKSYKVGKHPTYPKKDWIALCKQNAIVSEEKQREIEQARQEADLMYCIMFNPNKIETDEDGNEIGTIIDVVLKMCMDICHKKYGPNLKKAYPISIALDYLYGSLADHYPKLFMIFHILVKEPEAVEFFKCTFQIESKGNIWGDTCIAHFNTFCNKLEKLINDTRNLPFSEFNIISIMEECVRIAKRLYMTE